MKNIIKDFSLIFCSLFAYVKVLNINNLRKVKIAHGIILSIILACLTCFLRPFVSNATYVLMAATLIIYAKFETNAKTSSVVVTMIISIGMSYGSFLIAAVISSGILRTVMFPINMIIMVIITVIFQFIIINIPFRFKRLKKGFLFLQKERVDIVGIIISAVILISIIILGGGDIDFIIKEILIAAVVVCVAAMILWWRRGLTKLYRERVKERNTKEYEAIIEEKDRQIQTLTENNDLLAKVIHRDNKLLPAMYSAVRTFLDTRVVNDEYYAEGEQLVSQLEELMRERSETFLHNQRKHKALPPTKIPLVDNTLSYMLTKATEHDIQFDITITGNIKGLTEIISELKLQTLIADFAENAIIATSGCQYKRILVIAGTADDIYELSIRDSGIPFEAYTLANLGNLKITTHGEDGGSGIGYMTTFEILREVSASLIITEYKPKEYGFTKDVKIRFDGNGQYIIHSHRANDIRAHANHTDIIVQDDTVLKETASV